MLFHSFMCLTVQKQWQKYYFIKKRCIFRLVGYEGSFMVNLSLDFRTYQGNGVILYHKFRNIHSFIHSSFLHPTILQCSPKKVKDALLGPPAELRSPTCNQQCLPIFPFFCLLSNQLFLKILLWLLSFRNLFYHHGSDKSLTETRHAWYYL